MCSRKSFRPLRRGTDLGDRLKSGVAAALFRGLSNRVVENVSGEFREAIGALADGYRAALPDAKFSRQQVVDAVVAIELDNLGDGILRRLAMPSLPVRPAAVVEALDLCAHDHPDPRCAPCSPARPMRPSPRTVAAATASLVHQDHRTGFACTGFSLPGGRTADGLHLHARNLDADLYNWNVGSTLFLIDETDGHPGWHRYVAFGTVGLIYPGGISGMNDAGIAVSLHQLSTTRYRIRFGTGRVDIAPFVQQRILREAGSLEEAVEIVPARAAVLRLDDLLLGRRHRAGAADRVQRRGDPGRPGGRRADRADQPFPPPRSGRAPVRRPRRTFHADLRQVAGDAQPVRDGGAGAGGRRRARHRRRDRPARLGARRGTPGRWRSGVASTSRPPGSSARSGGCRARRTASLAALSVAIRRDGPGKTRHG